MCWYVSRDLKSQKSRLARNLAKTGRGFLGKYASPQDMFNINVCKFNIYVYHHLIGDYIACFPLFNRKSSSKSCGCLSSVMNDYSKIIVNSVENSSPLASTWEDDPGACHLQRHSYVVCLIVLSVWIFSVVVSSLIWSQVICSPLTYVYQK